MPDFIQCDGTVNITNNGQWVRCRSDEATVLTESEAEALFQSQEMDAQTAYVVSGVIFACCLFSWGIKLGLKQFNLGI